MIKGGQNLKKTNSKHIIFTIIVASILWYLLFVVKPMNFWLEMSLSISALVLMAFIFNKNTFKLGKITKRHIVIGFS